MEVGRAEPVVGLGVVEPLRGQLQVLRRLSPPALFRQNRPELQVGVGVIRIELEGLLQTPDGPGLPERFRQVRQQAYKAHVDQGIQDEKDEKRDKGVTEEPLQNEKSE